GQGGERDGGGVVRYRQCPGGELDAAGRRGGGGLRWDYCFRAGCVRGAVDRGPVWYSGDRRGDDPDFADERVCVAVSARGQAAVRPEQGQPSSGQLVVVAVVP